MRARPALSGLLVALAHAVACHRPAPGSGDAALAATLHTYVVGLLTRNPTMNTYLGGSGLDPALRDVDGRLRDDSPAAIADEDHWLESERLALDNVPTSPLSSEARIDREVALAQIAFLLHQHQVRRYQERALDTYALEPFRAIDWQLQGLTTTGAKTAGTPDEWTLVVARVKAVPAFLDAAETELKAGVASGNTPDRRMIVRDGIGTAESAATYFGATLPDLASDRLAGPDRTHVLDDLKVACGQAAGAYRRFRDFVTATYFTDATAKTLKPAFTADRFALGETEYDWALQNNLRVTETAARLFDESWPIVQATRQQMIELARKVGAEQNLDLPADGAAAVRAVFDRLSQDAPASDAELLAWYRDEVHKLVDYGRETRLFDIPDDYQLEVTETPPPLQASIDGAAYYPAPPFKQTGVGHFYVSPTHDDRAALQASNRASLADLAAHEGFPGHDWYYKVLTDARDRVSPVRWLTPGSVEDSASMWEDSMAAEGWALYAEGLLAEPAHTAPGGFYSSAEHLYQLQGELYRDLRVRIDTGLHTGRMTYDEATTLFSETVDFLPGSCGPTDIPPAPGLTPAKRASCAAAERAIFRYSKWPTQAITYRLGKDQILALRADAEKALGDAFSPKNFHLAFIREGTIPPGYFRDTLLAELQKPR